MQPDAKNEIVRNDENKSASCNLQPARAPTRASKSWESAYQVGSSLTVAGQQHRKTELIQREG
jgi:hypothetical protein